MLPLDGRTKKQDFQSNFRVWNTIVSYRVFAKQATLQTTMVVTNVDTELILLEKIYHVLP